MHHKITMQTRRMQIFMADIYSIARIIDETEMT
jgi:hypothetical protein